MSINVKHAENLWKKAIKLLNQDCPKKSWFGAREDENIWTSFLYIIHSY